MHFKNNRGIKDLARLALTAAEYVDDLARGVTVEPAKPIRTITNWWKSEVDDKTAMNIDIRFLDPANELLASIDRGDSGSTTQAITAIREFGEFLEEKTTLLERGETVPSEDLQTLRRFFLNLSRKALSGEADHSIEYAINTRR